LYDHLKLNYPGYDSEVEVSVDETDSVTTPFEHFFIASELNRLGVKFVSLAPRFIGSFEKGIDYKGDLSLFKREYIKHLKIASYFGSYKISLHSGSDKFSVYKVIGSLQNSHTHIKTAGTSYLEALKAAAIREPGLFREILDYCRDLYETEKKSYHVSADIALIRRAEEYPDSGLVSLFNSDDLRQILHVTFGRVLTDKDENGKYIFKERLLECLKRNEDIHYELLINHFRRHLEPFEERN
jgi:tagaturonate epimerase